MKNTLSMIKMKYKLKIIFPMGADMTIFPYFLNVQFSFEYKAKK